MKPGKFEIVSSFEPAGDQAQAIASLSSGLAKGYKCQTLKGVTGSGKTFTMAKVIENAQVPTLVISHNKTLAAQLYREFSEFFPNNAVEYFVSYYDYYQPEAYVVSKDLYIEKDSSINDEIDRMRLSATSALMERRDVIIVATVSCIYGLGSPASFHDMRIKLSRGQVYPLADIAKKLVTLQYERNNDVLERGNFRIRGDVLEIYPAYMKEALRIEQEWDEIRRITRLNPLDFSVIEELTECTVYPAKHFVIQHEDVVKAVDVIRAELDERYETLLGQNKLVEAQRLKTRTEYDLEMLKGIGYCSGIENYSRHLSGRKEGERPAVLIDYFPEKFLTFIDESHVTLSQIRGMFEGDRSRKLSLVNYGFRLPSALDNRPLYYDEFESMQYQRIFVSATPREEELNKSENIAEQVIRPTGLLDPEIVVRGSTGQIEDLYHEIKKRITGGERTLVTTLTKKMAEDLTDYLSGMGLKVRYLHSDIETIERVEILRDLRSGLFDVLVGINLLREGLDLPEVSLIAILDADKTGFLRSATSLIQTIGRAARNVNGTVIMYADKVSSAMEEAIRETARRRQIQSEHNRLHGLTPQTIVKAVQDILIRRTAEKRKTEELTLEIMRNSYNLLIPKDRDSYIRQLEKQMLEHAKNLEFEEAAVIRDELLAVKKG
ncbi:MAG: excinuclease ABC subunit B [Spirochaetales bacterium]|nr:MAG: excinuclease ABC subunit B [Spirochaetales bacterium]